MKTPIALTPDAVYSAWEPGDLCHSHSTVTHVAGRWYGQVGSRSLPTELEALPAGSVTRIECVRAWHDEQYDEAHRLIRQAYPERAFREAGMGELWTAI